MVIDHNVFEDYLMTVSDWYGLLNYEYIEDTTFIVERKLK